MRWRGLNRSLVLGAIVLSVAAVNLAAIRVSSPSSNSSVVFSPVGPRTFLASELSESDPVLRLAVSVVNTGDSIAEVQLQGKSCSCLEVTPGEFRLEPRGSQKLTIAMPRPATPQKQSYYYLERLQIGGVSSSVRIHDVVTVLPEVEVEPEQLICNWSAGESGTEKVRQITVRRNIGVDAEESASCTLGIKDLPEGIRLKKMIGPKFVRDSGECPNHEWTLKLEVTKSSNPLQVDNGIIQVQLTDKTSTRNIKIPCRLAVSSGVVASCTHLRMAQSAKLAGGIVILTSMDGTAFSVVRVDIKSGDGKVASGKMVESTERTVQTVSFTPDDCEGLDAPVTALIQTNHSASPEIEVVLECAD